MVVAVGGKSPVSASSSAHFRMAYCLLRQHSKDPGVWLHPMPMMESSGTLPVEFTINFETGAAESMNNTSVPTSTLFLREGHAHRVWTSMRCQTAELETLLAAQLVEILRAALSLLDASGGTNASTRGTCSDRKGSSSPSYAFNRVSSVFGLAAPNAVKLSRSSFGVVDEYVM